MTTVVHNARKLLSPYNTSSEVAEVISSVKRIARAVVADGDISDAHKMEVLSLVQWKISEANGKYSTRYRSAEVVRLAGYRNPPTTRIQHEHVYTRVWISRSILEAPQHLDELLNLVVGCVVTVDEHRLLQAPGEGWRRYRDAHIEVLDMATDPPSPLKLSE